MATSRLPEGRDVDQTETPAPPTGRLASTPESGSSLGELAAPGLLTVLVLVAGVVLLFTGRYPRDVFALVVGICRWVLRVTAYVLLMRDEYPPFRLDR